MNQVPSIESNANLETIITIQSKLDSNKYKTYQVLFNMYAISSVLAPELKSKG